jgi:predicted PurR-regulated permease PerM
MPSSTAATAGDRLTTVMSYGVLLLLLYLVFRIYEPFLKALGWAAVLVVFFYPLHERLRRRLGSARAAAISTAGVTLLLIVPTILLATLFVREAVAASRSLEQALVQEHAVILTRAWRWIASHVPGADPNLDVLLLLREAAQRQAGVLAQQIGTVVRNLATFVFDLFVMVFAMFYIFRDADEIIRGVRHLLPFEKDHREGMIVQARDLISASVTTSLILAAIQGVLGGLAFAIVKLPTPLFWGVVMAFFSLVPVVGSGLIFVPAALWLAFTGHWGSALVLVAVCAGVSTIADNALRPLLLGGRTELSGLVIFISVVGGVSVFGMLGLVLGPILVATAAGILGAYVTRAEKEPMTAR